MGDRGVDIQAGDINGHHNVVGSRGIGRDGIIQERD